MEDLQRLLFDLTDALLPAVLLGLLALLAWTVYTLGGFAREAVHRARRTPGAPPAGAADAAALDRLEQHYGRRVDAVALASRLGPMLGLAGTLIPLGPGLRAFGAGDSAAFAQKLMVAFSTTVAGLVVCGLCHWIASVRGRWYEHDLRLLEATAGGDRP